MKDRGDGISSSQASATGLLQTEISRFSASSPELVGWLSEILSLQRRPEPSKLFSASLSLLPATETLVRRDSS
jgi:hypothetical protein